MSKASRKTSTGKPAKPCPDFPLFAHATKRWAKKIRGKLHYFGPWDNAEAALQRYLDQKDDLHAGRTPRAAGGGLTVRELLGRFQSAKRRLLDTRQIASRTFLDYRATCKRIGEIFGLSRPVDDLAGEDFEHLRRSLAKTRGPVALGNEIQRVRVVFKYAFDAGLVDAPIRYGPKFKRPSKRVLRKARRENGPRMFEADEIRAMIAAARPRLRAMILLAVNCGFSNADCATLPIKTLDLEAGWVNCPQPRTGIPRRCPLWPETASALRVALQSRPKPKERADTGLVFITKYGHRWAKDSPDNPVSKETAKLLSSLGLHRRGRNFYALRHTFETIGGDSRDRVAVDHIMGRAPDDMAGVYGEQISDERLRAVTDRVRKWLFEGERGQSARSH